MGVLQEMKKPVKRIESWIGVDLDGTLAEWNGWESCGKEVIQ